MRTTRAIAGLALLLLAVPAFAWNYEGHRIIAAIAYDRLTPAVRARVDALIRKHPDYETILTKDAPADPAARARYAFLTAATWPDLIRGDPRFYDENWAAATPAPPIAGFPDSKRHLTWHYYDNPYSADGTPGAATPPPNALTELRRLIPEIRTAKIGQTGGDALAAYDLPWIEHLIGDVHQPLHATSRYLKSQPQGDQGGNLVFVAPGRNLHAIWDNSPGIDLSEAYTAGYAHEVTLDYPESPGLSLDPKDWIDESYALDKSDVYTFGLETGSQEKPVRLPRGYEENARKIARRRVAMAGYRLARVLDQQLR